MSLIRVPHPAPAAVALCAILLGVIDAYYKVKLGHDFDLGLITAGFGGLGVSTVRTNGNNKESHNG